MITSRTADHSSRTRSPGIHLLGATAIFGALLLFSVPLPVAAQPATTPTTETPSTSQGYSLDDLADSAACLVNPVGCAASQVGGVVANAVGTGLTNMALDILIAVSWFMLMFANLMLGIAGTLFNWVLLVTVYQFGTYFGNSEGILLAWGVLRDLANIVLLFGFIFMGLQTILDIGHFNVKKALPRLLIFAVLMNFSLFATQAIIDTTNVFSAVMSTQAGTGCTIKPGEQEDTKTCVQQGIAGKIMTGTGLAAMFSGDVNQTMYSDKQKGAVIFLGAALLSAIGAIVLFSGAIMLLIRAIVLVFLMVLSPLGFAAFALPQFEEIAKKWWHALIGNAVSAPAFILMILISLKIAEQFQTTTGGPVAGNVPSLIAGLAAENTSSLGVFLIYAIVIGFLIASMVVAKKVGAMGASFATSAGGKAVGTVLLGGMGFAGRRLVGGAANAAKGEIVKARRSGLINQRNSRYLFEAADWATKQSFDPRSAKIGGTTLSDAAKKVSVDLGKPGKAAAHGFHGIEEEHKKKLDEYGKALKLTDEDKEIVKGIKAEVSRLNDLHKEEISDLKNDFNKQRDRQLAPIDNQISSIETRMRTETDPAAKAALEQELAAAESARAKIVATNREEYVAAKAKLDKAQKDKVEVLDKQRIAIEGNYAQHLEARSHKRIIPAPFSPEGVAEHHFAEEKLEKLKKSDAQKAIDRLEAAVKKSGEDTSHAVEHIKQEIHNEHGGGDHGGGGGDGHGGAHH